MSSKIEVNVSHRFNVSAETYYDAWLDPDKVRAWQRKSLQKMELSGEIGKIETDPKVGGAFLFTDMRDGVEARH